MKESLMTRLPSLPALDPASVLRSPRGSEPKAPAWLLPI